MTKRLACPPAPGPLEDYAQRFDALFARLAQRRGLRAYLQGLLLDDPATAPHDQGVLVLDDTGDRTAGRHTAPPTTPAGVDGSAFTPADLAEIVRLYSLRDWVEQSYKQVEGELGWADFQVRGDRAIRRHWTLVCCAFSFCWRAWFAEHPPPLHLYLSP